MQFLTSLVDQMRDASNASIQMVEEQDQQTAADLHHISCHMMAHGQRLAEVQDAINIHLALGTPAPEIDGLERSALLSLYYGQVSAHNTVRNAIQGISTATIIKEFSARLRRSIELLKSMEAILF